MSQISDQRVNNNCKLSHAGIRSRNYRNDRSAAALYDQVLGAIEMLQVPLHFKHFYLYCHISPISEGRKGLLGQLTTHILYQPVTILTKEN